ncbi:Tm-1-like ATP-binding domain-containing protein [Cyclobacterium roseum]|uniref:Tm-1-like ATP-binding domain-containing protein n=1 Tax=Cyclobacterium roseum TaxID=2666137 RepID=UPI001390A79A|nr:Tm-1-like ATP-binding domain-containing protein [Cyclobacterium roseum]
MPPSFPAFFVLGCFDTKGEVFAHLREQLLARGESVLCINAGIFGSTDLFPVDVEADYLANLAGSSLHDLREKNDRGLALEVMARGAGELFRSFPGQIKGVIGMGGGGGTYLLLKAMQVLPLGLPKICISTLATRDVSHLVGVKDIVLMPSVVDVAGLNAIIRPIIDQAAAALSAMSKVPKQRKTTGKGTLAISMFGNTTDCVNECTRMLQEKGYEVMAFHANGVGGKAMEALIREGVFDAVLDLTTTELADERCGGILSAGPDRLRAAAEMGIPNLLAPGCLDMVNFGPRESVPETYKDRLFYQWAPDVTLMRTNEEENFTLGKVIAEKLNRSKNKAKTKVLIPSKGFSQLDAPGNYFHDEKCVKAFEKALKTHLDPEIECIPVALPVNDVAFAKEAVAIMLDMLEGKKP